LSYGRFDVYLGTLSGAQILTDRKSPIHAF